jgi:hypothetical protein
MWFDAGGRLTRARSPCTTCCETSAPSSILSRTRGSLTGLLFGIGAALMEELTRDGPLTTITLGDCRRDGYAAFPL